MFGMFLDTTEFSAVVEDFPGELKPKCEAAFTVSINKEIVASNKSRWAEDSKISCSSSKLKNYVKNNTFTLTCRLEVVCENDYSLRRQFFDRVVTRKFISDSVANMFGDPTFADFTFIVNGKELKAHMNILAAASPVMRKMFLSNLKEAKTRTCTVSAIRSDAFVDMLAFIYRADVPDFMAGYKGISLYDAAHYYEIENLKIICAEGIHESLTAGNAMEVFEWVQPYDLMDLKMDAWKIIKR